METCDDVIDREAISPFWRSRQLAARLAAKGRNRSRQQLVIDTWTPVSQDITGSGRNLAEHRRFAVTRKMRQIEEVTTEVEIGNEVRRCIKPLSKQCKVGERQDVDWER